MSFKGTLAVLYAASLCAVTAGAGEIQPITVVPAPDAYSGPQAATGKSRVQSEPGTWISAGTNPGHGTGMSRSRRISITS